ncbi:PA2928 family protein [Aquabacterium humicola]|uniref:PA2928 family protein n=1 Tax=Aquabacterium humicola TaxID=3237377 RepID=UPI00254301E3|nr:PA2928 family protein [Rubrivivax pictus]
MVALVAIVTLCAAIGAAVMFGWRTMQRTEFTPPRREGPPALVMHEGRAALWLMVKLEERRRFGRSRYNTRYHLELRAHDGDSGELLWTRRLRSLDENQDGSGARGRILGQQGDRVWLFVHDTPVAVAASDGTVKATLLDVLAANPALQGVVTNALDNVAFDDGLVLVTADARRHRIAAPPALTAAPYEPASEQAFSDLRFRASRWNGGFDHHNFLTPQARTGTGTGGWLGLFTPAEAKAAADDPWGDHLKQPDRTWRSTDREARRSLWNARFGRTREFSEGSHERIVALTPLPQSPEYLQGGFLREAGQPRPLLLDDSALFVVHRTRTDAAGRAVLTQLVIDREGGAKPGWSATLPFTELRNRWQLPGRLLMFGTAEITDAEGQRRHEESLASVELRSGRLQGWLIERDSPLVALRAPTAAK